MRYYIWANESCDNTTLCYNEAMQWALEFIAEGATDVRIVDADDNTLFSGVTHYV